MEDSGLTLFWEIFTVVILVAISAISSGAESAFFSLSSKDIADFKASNSKVEARVLWLHGRKRMMLASVLLLNTLVNLGIALQMTDLVSKLTGSLAPWLQTFIDLAVVTLTLVIFGEVLPKTYSTYFNRQVSRLTSWPMIIAYYLLWPMSYGLNILVGWLQGKGDKPSNQSPSLEELKLAIELTHDDSSTKEEKEILRGILDFKNAQVKQVMQPRMDMTCYEYGIKYDELLKQIEKDQFSRVPIYRESRDNIEGVLFIKDLVEHLDKDASFLWQEVIRPAQFVPESKRLESLLKEFRTGRSHMAIVVDEYGGTAGLITLEDILEEIVGDLKDEFDAEEQWVRNIEGGGVVVAGKMALAELSRVLEVEDWDWEALRGEAETVGGMVLEIKNKVPHVGEKFEVGKWLWEVTRANKRRVLQVSITEIANNSKNGGPEEQAE